VHTDPATGAVTTHFILQAKKALSWEDALQIYKAQPSNPLLHPLDLFTYPLPFTSLFLRVLMRASGGGGGADEWLLPATAQLEHHPRHANPELEHPYESGRLAGLHRRVLLQNTDARARPRRLQAPRQHTLRYNLSIFLVLFFFFLLCGGPRLLQCKALF
jgi:hypothetical protein